MHAPDPDTTPPIRRTPRIWRHTLFASAMAAAVAGMIAAIDDAPPRIVDHIFLNDTRNRVILWERRVLDLLDAGAQSFVNGDIGAQAATQLSQITRQSDIYRLKLFDAQGRIIWSSRSAEIGQHAENSAFDTIVAGGEIFAKLDTKPPGEIDRLALHSQRIEGTGPRTVAEVYTPVHSNGQFVGAAEFYTDITDLRAAFIARVRWIMMALGIIGGSLSLLGIGYVVRASRRRMREVQQIATQERQALAQQKRLSREVGLLGELNEWLQSSNSLDELFSMVARFMTHLIPDAEGSIYVYSNSRDVLDGGAAWNGGSIREHIRPDECWALRRGRTYGYGTNAVNFACDHVDAGDDRPYFCFPILAHGETVGLLHLRSRMTDTDTRLADNRLLAQMCAEQISMAIANVRMRDALQEQAIRDPLTGLFNRRHMGTHLRSSLKHCQHKGEPLALVAVDVDHFKKFNDTHGHDAGDLVLAAVGETMQRLCDGDEIAARPGGEEFTMILPHADKTAARARAEALREAVENITVHYGEATLPHVTLSLGIAVYPEDGTTPQDLLHSADAALYRAKDNGRNQVCGRADEIGDNAAATRPSVMNGSAPVPKHRTEGADHAESTPQA